METVFLIQFAPLGKRWRRFTENLILSLFNFNFVQGAIPRTRVGGGLLGKRAQEVWEKKRIIIINKKLTGKINNYEEKMRNHFMLGNNFGVFKVFIITVRLILFIKNSFMN